MSGEQGEGAVSRWSVGLLLAGALLVAGLIAWRTLDDAPPEPAKVQEGGPLSLEELRAQAHADPANAEAWQELGFALFERGDFAESAASYRRAVEADAEQAVLWSAYGEALVMASERDPMPQEALSAFRRASEIDPSDARARYFLAVHKDLGGDHEGAIADWLALLGDTPAGAPWEDDLRRTIDQVGKINGIETADRIADAMEARSPIAEGPELTGGSAIPGPSREQIAAAGAMAPGEQRQMAIGMVERLEARLAGDPGNVDGWVMLMRSRMTLGEPEKARRALAEAIAANPSAASRLRQEGELLGVR